MITIFTDGSSRGNPGPGGYGAIISRQKTVNSKQIDWVTEIGGGDKHTTNNRMELTACIRALESIDLLPTDHCLLFTDSQYVVKGITEWIHGWESNGWKTSARKPVENQDLWQVLSHNVENKNIEWKFVKGHNGHSANERCDEIATSFADNAATDLYDGPTEAYSIKLAF